MNQTGDLFSTVSVNALASENAAHVRGSNFRLTGDRDLPASWKERAAANIRSIALANVIEDNGRGATEAEQSDLIRFMGFGASDLANNMFPLKGQTPARGWEQLVSDLSRLVTKDERASLQQATQYAHYTPEFIVRALWSAVRRLGFAGGSVLEPGCGTGLFLAMVPEAVADLCQFTGIERDQVTARIATLLYPEADIRMEDFARSNLPANFDLVIGNPPFANTKIVAKGRAGDGLSLHDFFITRSLDLLRPGGIAAFVVSRWTMDKQDRAAREQMASMADLIGAIRLPQGAMAADAGTDVVVDLLFFRKREEGAAPSCTDWLKTEIVGNVPFKDETFDLIVNRHFAERPYMVLGEHAVTSSQFGPTYTCRRADMAGLQAALSAAVEIIAPGAEAAPAERAGEAAAEPEGKRTLRVRVGTAATGARIKEGSFFFDDSDRKARTEAIYDQADRATGADRKRLLADAAKAARELPRLYQVIDGEGVEVEVKAGRDTPGIYAKNAGRIAGLVPVKEAVRDVLRAQEADEDWSEAQTRLNKVYDAFVAEFGPINKTVISERTNPITGQTKEYFRYPNLAPFRDDPDCWLVASIEHYDVDSGDAAKGPIFSKRVILPPPEAEITCPADALAVVLNERGKVDMARIAELLGVTEDAAVEGLGDLVYLNPVDRAWETTDAYLSGMVREKLTEATKAAVNESRFDRNVEALKAVQPADLPPSDISARLGSPWLPTDVIRDFIYETMDVRTDVHHTAEIGSWSVNQWAFSNKASSTTEWGTPRRHAGDLMLDALNSNTPQIFDTDYDANGKKIRVLNAPATEAAKEKLAAIKRAFEGWVWTDTDRADRLAGLYNLKYNNMVPRVFNGDHLMLPGASNVVTLRRHQMRGAWRMIVSGNTYLAHVVGAGKTLTKIAGIMEQKRLGLVAKPMLTVPGHTLAQWAREFLMLYPNAKILVADEENFAKDKRQRFMARAATDQWDAIIVTHSAFKFIPAPYDFERGMIREQIFQYQDLLEAVDEDDRVSVKRLEALKDKMENRLAALGTDKDDMLTIAEMGVDQLLVDEAQEFRKLSFSTNMGTIKGVDPDGSQRAWDLYVKTKFVQTVNPGREIVMGSGTPITNTMGEMFTLLRYMNEAGMTLRGVQHFDAWASTFCETRTELELQASGSYKPISRLATFVNIPELTAVFREVADVVLMADLREYVKLPRIKGGKRQILTYAGSDAFKAYQKVLAARIQAIADRPGRPQKGDDIILSVITDGRHAAIDMRMSDPAGDLAMLDMEVRYKLQCPALLQSYQNDEANKLNGLIGNVFHIWKATSDRQYRNPVTGEFYPATGAAQMIFSDLGTEGAETKRGFSAYQWIRQRLIAMGVPADQIAIMQHYKKVSEKQRLFNDINQGRVRVVIMSSATATGVNAQQRLVALHHLDVPWIPSLIEQREGRIERQGNQNDEIAIYAYATRGSMDATMWQTNERKAGFIGAMLKGDTTIRTMEDLEATQADQFAMAKALASGDDRLLKKAGLEMEIGRLRRQRDAWRDSQANVRFQIRCAKDDIATADAALERYAADIAKRAIPAADAFTITIEGKVYTDRKEAGDELLGALVIAGRAKRTEKWLLAEYGGFEIEAEGWGSKEGYILDLAICRTKWKENIRYGELKSGAGILNRIETMLLGFEDDVSRATFRKADGERKLADYLPRQSDAGFDLQAVLDDKLVELQALDADLAKGDTETQAEVANDDSKAEAVA